MGESKIDSMVAGRELNELVAREVMGWHSKYWRPSTDRRHIWHLVAQLECDGYWLKLTSPFDPSDPNLNQWHAGFTPHSTTGWNGRPDWRASGDTAMLAICRAALKVRMEEPAL